MSKSRSDKDEVVELPLTVKASEGDDVTATNEEPVVKSNRAERSELIDWYKSLPLLWKIILGIILFVIVAGIIGFLVYNAIKREKTMGT